MLGELLLMGKGRATRRERHIAMAVEDSPIRLPLPAPPSASNPEPQFRTLLGGRPVVLVELPDGSTAWLVGGHEEVRQVIIDQRFSRALAVAPGRSVQGTEVFAAGSIMGIDPPEHTRLRKLVSTAFTARRVEALRPRAAAIVHQLIDGLLGQPEPADLITHFSLALPVQVICEMLGVPSEDLGQFHGWSDTILSDWQADSGEIMAALVELYNYFARLIEMKRAEPAEDFMTALIAARDEGDRLSEEELTTLGCTLLIGGHETTANQINLSLLCLLDHPDELAKLRADPGPHPGGGGGAFAVRPARERPAACQGGQGGCGARPRHDTGRRVGAAAVRHGQPRSVGLQRRRPARRDPRFGQAPGVRCRAASLPRRAARPAGVAGGVPRPPRADAGTAAGGCLARELRFKPGMAVHSLCELPVAWSACCTRREERRSGYVRCVLRDGDERADTIA